MPNSLEDGTTCILIKQGEQRMATAGITGTQGVTYDIRNFQATRFVRGKENRRRSFKVFACPIGRMNLRKLFERPSTV
jgi:hypothetical protein